MSRSDKIQLGAYAVFLLIVFAWWGVIHHATKTHKAACTAAGGVPIVSTVFGGQEVICVVGKVIKT